MSNTASAQLSKMMIPETCLMATGSDKTNIRRKVRMIRATSIKFSMLKIYLRYETDSWKSSLRVKMIRNTKVAHFNPVSVGVSFVIRLSEMSFVSSMVILR